MNDRSSPMLYVYLTSASAAILLVAASAVLGRADGPSGISGSAASQPAARPADDAFATLGRGIVGSKHDFSDSGRVPRDLCTPCHTPHITAAQAPLLVGRTAASQPARSYQTRAGELNAASLVCLSCHDGTVARDVYAGSHASTWSDRSMGGVAPGKSQLTNHPVGVRYPEGQPGYQSSAAVAGPGRIKLPDGRIQCTTCHDPHNTQGFPGMLVISNDRSRLCLSCHRL